MKKKKKKLFDFNSSLQDNVNREREHLLLKTKLMVTIATRI